MSFRCCSIAATLSSFQISAWRVLIATWPSSRLARRNMSWWNRSVSLSYCRPPLCRTLAFHVLHIRFRQMWASACSAGIVMASSSHGAMRNSALSPLPVRRISVSIAVSGTSSRSAPAQVLSLCSRASTFSRFSDCCSPRIACLTKSTASRRVFPVLLLRSANSP